MFDISVSMKMSKVSRCATVGNATVGNLSYVDRADTYKVLPWVIFYTHLNINSTYTADLTCLFCMCRMQALTLLKGNIRFSFISGT